MKGCRGTKRAEAREEIRSIYAHAKLVGWSPIRLREELRRAAANDYWTFTKAWSQVLPNGMRGLQSVNELDELDSGRCA